MTKTQFTVKEWAKFMAFAKRHGMTFNTKAEALAAIAQYYKG